MPTPVHRPTQPPLFPSLAAKFPSTRYQGSKAKLAGWIGEQVAGLDFTTCLDTFGGTSAVAYRFKQAGKEATYNDLTNPYQSALAFFALCQACIIKRPYNLFRRKNLYLRFADVERLFGNKITWDRPFDEWFRIFVEEANQAIFDNGQANRALNHDATDVPGEYDLVYVDTPYISKRGVAVDYLDFYHFLEGLTMYDEWGAHLDRRSKHRRLKPHPSEWTDKARIHAAFDRLFRRYQASILVVSYRSDGIPSEAELASLLKQYKRHVRVEHYGQYEYVLSTNSEAGEILLIGT